MIAIDAMGGDYAPLSLVQGAYQAALKKIPVQLFGDEAKLIAILNSLDKQWESYPITLVHCSQIIHMEDRPARSILRKKDSSLMGAVHSVAASRAKAVVSAGNSGAALAAGMMVLGRTKGILRPAIGGFLPTHKDSVFCTDLGANVDCKPEFLYQFAIMGSAYVRLVKGIEHPKIALLSK